MENDGYYDGEMCEKCCDARRGPSSFIDILQGVAPGCTQSPNLFKISLSYTMIAVEAATQAVTVGEYVASGLISADMLS